MRRFNISVNGNSYDVAVEEVGASVTSAPVAAPAPAPGDGARWNEDISPEIFGTR